MNLKEHVSATRALSGEYKPEFLRLKKQENKLRFEKLLETSVLFLHDETEGQLRELMKSRHPSRQLGDKELQELMARHTEDLKPEEYGVWVYYPWNARMVHILDEGEFTELRTSRNQYKITREEQLLLSQKTVGIIGLSVGQSVALTMAMERSFGEIRLADFDVLELTNLNRIRTGIHNLGLKKVISVAREIAEIDPFLPVRVFPEGLNEDNMDDFYTGGGKLDVLVDECDEVAMKILCRRKAKDLGIPVLMEASDRCTVDVERFDLDPERPVLHGYIDHLDLSRVKYLKTNEEKIPYLAPMVGMDTMSVRLKASALEVGHSITTWPQLASAVVMGGGVVGDIWRRIALGQFCESGRYFVDLEELIGNNTKNPERDDPDRLSMPQKPDPQQMTASADRYLLRGKAGSAVPPQELVRTLVTAAGMAPSGGNSQPWNWVYREGVLFLFIDRYEGYSYMNFKDTASLAALGAAIENLVLKAHEHDLELNIDYFPVEQDAELVATFCFYGKEPGRAAFEPHHWDELVHYIEKRHTNRKFPPRTDLPGEILSGLKQAGETVPGVRIRYIEDEQERSALGRIIGMTDRYRILDPESNYDFIHREMRWSAEEAESRRTGMEVSALELRESELVGLKFIKDPGVIAFISKMNGGHLLENASAKNAASASAFGLLTVPASGELDFLKGGRAFERLWLRATQLGVAVHPMNVPLAYFARIKQDPGSLSQGSSGNVRALYEQFIKIFNYSGSEEEVFLFRLFRASEPARRPYRKRIDDILICE